MSLLNQGSNPPDSGTSKVALTMGAALAFGLLAVFVSLASSGTVARGLMWAAAWSSIGWFLGFLFGIPRFLSTDTARRPGASNAEATKKDHTTAVANAKSARERAGTTAADRDSARSEVDRKLRTAAQAESDAGDARARSGASPQDAALQAEAAGREATAEKARMESDAAIERLAQADEAATAAAAAAADAEATAEKLARTTTTAASESASAPNGASLTVNTNLEQISDWLTKIIVGVSLVESQALLSKLDAAASFMARSMAPPDQLAAMAGTAVSARHAAEAASSAGAGPALAASAAELGALSARHLEIFGSTHSLAYAVILYFLATGLLGSYLLTRLFLQPALNGAAGQPAA